MTNIMLFTTEMEYVITVKVPTMKPEPDIIIWNERYFILTNGQYLEGFAIVATETIVE
jgi:hypothetical protein